MKVGILLLLFLVPAINSLFEDEKEEFCRNITCENRFEQVCGIREEGEGIRLRLFQDECELLKYGCKVKEDQAYGLINLEYCNETFSTKTIEITTKASCIPENCDRSKPICAIRQDGSGFRLKHFMNECQLLQDNCERELNFIATDDYLCDGMEMTTIKNESKEIKKDVINEFKETEINDLNKKDVNETQKPKPVFVVDGSMFYNGDVNKTIDNFFAATHLVNMPLQEVDNTVVNETTRRRLVKNAAAVVIYKPWVKIPENISDDILHRPTLSSCYHTCPSECPDTYAPVCGVPGVKAREPSLMFKNHCFMDIAQCKMHWEDIGPTAISSAYIDSPFIFCMGETLSRMYVLLPLIRTLQHMGRLRKKGHFHYKLRNMRFDNIAANKVMG